MTKKILYFAHMPTDLQIARFIQDQGYELYGIFDVKKVKNPMLKKY